MNDTCVRPRSMDETDITSTKERSPTITSTDDVDWSLSDDSFVIDFDDGHIPESLRYKQCDNSNSTSSNEQQSRQYMRIYPKYHDYPLCCERQHHHREVESTSNQISSSSSSVIPPFVYCIDDTIPIEILKALYLYTIKTNQPHSTWGTYVTMEQIRHYWNHNEEHHIENNHTNTFSLNRNEDIGNKDDDDVDLYSIVIPIAAHFIRNYIITNSCNQSSTCGCCCFPNLFNESETTGINVSNNESTFQGVTCACDSHKNITNHTIFDEAHGIAIWALASDVGAQVPYHIDYAELIRYETGIIVPPIIAGTLHCTSQYNTTFTGGDYCVIVCENGIDHYSKHGYKGKLKPVEDDDNNENKEFIQIPYKFNRMICQSGHLPHWSTKVESSTSTHQSNSSSSSSSNNKRVIVGLNVFCHDVGPIIQQAPEHSDAFRKRVKQHRFDTKKESMNMLSFNNIHTNPKLRRLLILAKREKKINDFKCAQQNLYERICIYLRNRKEPTTVRQVLDAFTPSTNSTQWPYDVHDVHVFLHKCWKDGHLRIIKNTNARESNLIEADTVIELIE